MFNPKLSVLPDAQRRLWPELAPLAAQGFVLYGGTAIALQLGHRTSIDFDFFTHLPIDRHALRAALPCLAQAEVLQDSRDTLAFLTSAHVKLSFFGNLRFGHLTPPQETQDQVAVVASLADLFATKLKVILQRAEAKDYRDIAALLEHNHDLAKGLGGARALFRDFQPYEALKALTYFGDGDLAEVSTLDRKTLADAIKKIGHVPDVTPASQVLTIDP